MLVKLYVVASLALVFGTLLILPALTLPVFAVVILTTMLTIGRDK